MTPQQMLRRIGNSPDPQPTPRQEQAERSVVATGDHIIKLLAPPAIQGARIKKSTAEPWLLEQLQKGWCPVCSEGILHQCCSFDTSKHFYTCEGSPVEHRWTIIED